MSYATASITSAPPIRSSCISTATLSFDFRYQRDAYADYFANSILATRAHTRASASCLGKPYTPDVIGASFALRFTAWLHCLGWASRRRPYRWLGGSKCNGRVAPLFCLLNVYASCIALRERYGKYAWGRYGFCDAFHPDAQWYDKDVLGIDLGISVLMAENLRTGLLWQTFMRNQEATTGYATRWIPQTVSSKKPTSQDSDFPC